MYLEKICMCIWVRTLLQTNTFNIEKRMLWKEGNGVEQQFEDASKPYLHSVIEPNSIWLPRVVRSSSSSAEWIFLLFFFKSKQINKCYKKQRKSWEKNRKKNSLNVCMMFMWTGKQTWKKKKKKDLKCV